MQMLVTSGVANLATRRGTDDNGAAPPGDKDCRKMDMRFSLFRIIFNSERTCSAFTVGIRRANSEECRATNRKMWRRISIQSAISFRRAKRGCYGRAVSRNANRS